MADTNGNVAVGHLYTYQGVPIARVIYPSLAAAAAEIRSKGATFSIILPVGGYRSLSVQRDMIAHPAKYNIAHGVDVAAPGKSHHGFGKAVDVASSLNHSAVVQIMRKHGFTQYNPGGDPDHFGWGNELTADGLATAGTGGTPIDNTPPTVVETDMAKPEFMQFNNIYWPNGYFANYAPAVYNSVQYYFTNGTEQPGTEGTVVREINTANAAIAALSKSTVTGGVTIDYDILATKVAALVKVPTADQNGAAARAAIVKP